MHTQICFQHFLTNSSHNHDHQRSSINTNLSLTGQHCKLAPFICNSEEMKQNTCYKTFLGVRGTNTATPQRIQPKMLCHCIRVVFLVSDSTREMVGWFPPSLPVIFQMLNLVSYVFYVAYSNLDESTKLPQKEL